MKQTMSCYDFLDQVRRCDRMEQFGRDGWCAIFDYIEAYEQDSGEEQECDVIAYCCDMTRYESIEEFNKEQGEECADLDAVADLTTVIAELDNGAFITVNY